mmetsp:Transcript_104298/g.319306  ORF Transcript_104298/g.319306 Transcript_104298/m.319306 type:complete len:222 (-) Transcript_104298:370-1035(-)
MHSVARPRRLPVRRISWRRSTAMRHPEAPIGWPMAIAPPLTLTLDVSHPRPWFTAKAWAAKASLASMRSKSWTVHCARSSAFLHAGMGPVPMTLGSTPALAKARIVARTSKPSSFALLADMSKQSAAPSLIPDALPAVTLPSFGLNAGFNFPSPSAEALLLMYSSDSNTPPLPTGTGTIWSLNLLAFCAAAAFCWDARAKASCAARFMPNCSATFSAVTPM